MSDNTSVLFNPHADNGQVTTGLLERIQNDVLLTLLSAAYYYGLEGAIH